MPAPARQIAAPPGQPWLRPLPEPRRCAVVDLGSNSVRLVVFEGFGRNPVAIFNEKAVLRLGRGLQATGRLNPDGMAQVMMVMTRYHAIARAMGADPFEVLATAAVRDASNGAACIAELHARLPGLSLRVLSGAEEAAFSAAGVLCGIPQADGILADIGGGSLELVQLRGGAAAQATTLALGVIRLAERCGGDLARARGIAAEELAGVDFLAAGQGRDLYAVGGAFRALARIHMAQAGYPLNIVHHYTIGRDAARELAMGIGSATRRGLERLAGVPRRRMEDLPYAAVALRRLLQQSGAARVVFSANGLREGWYMQRLPAAMRAEDPLLAAGHDIARERARDPAMPQALHGWTAPIFPDEDPAAARLRQAACWMSDLGSHDHPEYRAEQAFLRVLRQPGVALDHPSRAFLATVLALRYEAEPAAPFLAPARALLDAQALHRAECLGVALRLAYTLSGGTPALLAASRLQRRPDRLVLELAAGSGVFAGESVTRRLDRLGQCMGLPAQTDEVAGF